MDEKKYLKWYQKIAYGSGDLGSNFMYTFVSTFILIYMTDTVGLNAGIVGTLMMISKIFDGVTDVFFGSLIDKTHSKMGKARPWMFWSTLPLAVCEILLFMIPSAAPVIQYGYPCSIHEENSEGCPLEAANRQAYCQGHDQGAVRVSRTQSRNLLPAL